MNIIFRQMQQEQFGPTSYKCLDGWKTFMVLVVLLLCFQSIVNAQQPAPESLLRYMHGIRSKEALLVNIRGYEIIVDKAAGNFSKPYIHKMFPGFKLHQADKAIPDSSAGIPALRVEKQVSRNGIEQHGEYYFFPKNADTILGILISGSKLPDQAFKQALVNLVLHDSIPDSLISVLTSPLLLFAGRSILVDNRCRWMGANIMQCHGYGEMNWSLHPDIAEAQGQTASQEAINRSDKQFVVEKEEEVPVIFEGTAVTARRLQLKSKGVGGLMAKREGSRTLIVYYVTAEVRGHYVSCVLSHWTSDYIEENGLPPLLGTVMQLK